jgi:hypothetical protein
LVYSFALTVIAAITFRFITISSYSISTGIVGDIELCLCEFPHLEQCAF